MTYLILPQPGRRLAMGEAQTILQAALDAGIAYPHSCRSGRCGACKSRLVSGHVEMGKHSPFALSEQERADGLILACRAVPVEDVVVEWLDDAFETAQPEAQEADVFAIERMTHDIISVRLALADRAKFRFAAGQYLSLSLPGAPARNYSMASRPDEERVELHIRAVPGGRTSGLIHASLKAGDRVRIEGPAGAAYLREAHDGPIIALAGGSGLAPIKSIVETALHAGMTQPIHVYFGARAERDLYLVEHFRTLERSFANLTFVPVLSQMAAEGRRSGFVSDALAADHRDLTGARAYVAGPPAMVESCLSVLAGLGVTAGNVHADVFFTPEGSDNKAA